MRARGPRFPAATGGVPIRLRPAASSAAPACCGPPRRPATRDAAIRSRRPAVGIDALAHSARASRHGRSTRLAAVHDRRGRATLPNCRARSMSSAAAKTRWSANPTCTNGVRGQRQTSPCKSCAAATSTSGTGSRCSQRFGRCCRRSRQHKHSTTLRQHRMHQHHAVGRPEREVEVEVFAGRPRMHEGGVNAAGELF